MDPKLTSDYGEYLNPLLTKLVDIAAIYKLAREASTDFI